ncbi:ABC transporter substrate-binding protein [Brenneria corticis]|uniref:ABC transporter ATP-binding protein n=1 Tax=Brenneria corticis TaxID=2173106 RepID=A0A2U1TJS3_9GAMM|nr:ABC transporter substrate-binding protein [Brenneria sp. CFCC 11842]PWC09664.1 ABC transporter ATP-binding protein [Brenneria sp. CFCC 11842]
MRKLPFKRLLLSLAIGLASFAGQAASDDAPAPTDSVVIGVYGGDWEKNIRSAGLDRFAQENNIKVTVVAGADAEWFAKLRAAKGRRAPYDIVVFQPDTIQRAIAAGLLQPLEARHIANLDKLYSSVQQRFVSEGKTYAAAFSLGQLGLAYRSDLVPHAPKSWLDLWDPAYKGHVAVSSPTYAAGLQFFAGLVHALGGKLENGADVDKAFAKLAELKGQAVAFPDSPGAIQTLLERGDAWVVPYWDGRVFALKQQGLKIDFVYPSDGPVVGAANWAIPKGAPNLANAYKLVNYLSGAEVQKAFSDKSLYGMTNKEVQYSDSLKSQVQVGEEAYNQLIWIDYATATPKLAEWTARWSKALGGGQ